MEIKLLVLDNCLFNWLLYGMETWGDYNELKRADIISKFKDHQWKFYPRLLELNDEDALVKSFCTYVSTLQ